MQRGRHDTRRRRIRNDAWGNMEGKAPKVTCSGKVQRGGRGEKAQKGILRAKAKGGQREKAHEGRLGKGTEGGT